MRSRSYGMAVTAALALVVTVSPLAQGATPITKRISVSSAGAQAKGDSFEPAISGNGRFVAFLSFATNLVAGDTNGTWDVFVHDRNTRETERVSVRSNGVQANDRSFAPAISGNGRFVAFYSFATNLVAGDTNGKWDVYVHDRVTNKSERVSVASHGVQANDSSFAPAISGNGRFVGFESVATNLVAGDTNGSRDVFVHDRKTRETERVSVRSTGVQADDQSFRTAISGSGRFVAFISLGTNLVAGDTNDVLDVFVHDRETKTTKRVSVRSDGTQGNGDSLNPAISWNGRFIALNSVATNLIVGDINGNSDVFVHDRKTKDTERVSVRSNGTQARGSSFAPAISGNGRFVGFESDATNLVPGDTNGSSDVFIHDRENNRIKRVSMRSNGAQGDGDSFEAAISGNGRFFTFTSLATNLVASDSNSFHDVFVRGPLY